MTVYFQPMAVYIPLRPYIFGPRPYTFSQDRIFYQDRIFSRTVYFTFRDRIFYYLIVFSRLETLVKIDMPICLNSSIIVSVVKQLLMLVLLNRMLKQAWFILAIGSTIIPLTTVLMIQEHFSI